MNVTIDELKQSFAGSGIVRQILIRPAKRQSPVNVEIISVSAADGIAGDHYNGSAKNRQVTLIQYEHLPVIASLTNRDCIDPALLRRNVIVAGINLLALKECIFSLGTAYLKMTGLCHPCSRMEQQLGPGGYNAMRGHGGINATVISDGEIKVGDQLAIVEFERV